MIESEKSWSPKWYGAPGSQAPALESSPCASNASRAVYSTRLVRAGGDRSTPSAAAPCACKPPASVQLGCSLAAVNPPAELFGALPSGSAMWIASSSSWPSNWWCLRGRRLHTMMMPTRKPSVVKTVVNARAPLKTVVDDRGGDSEGRGGATGGHVETGGTSGDGRCGNGGGNLGGGDSGVQSSGCCVGHLMLATASKSNCPMSLAVGSTKTPGMSAKSCASATKL